MKEQNNSIKDLLIKAEEAEKDEDNALAINLYGQILKQDGLNTQSYNSLMKLYRRNKEYKKELSIINAGIKAYEKFYKARLKKQSSKVIDISQKLSKSIGLIDKKGINLYNPEPIATWIKRKAIVEKRLK
jgi:hypothetical protein